MTIATKSVAYNFVWQIKNAEQYKATKDGKIVDCHTMQELKRVVNGYSIGYNINGRFYSLSKLRTMLEKIPADDCPF